MLTSLQKIENLGVFSKYVAANDLPEFQRYNVIYGDNGSGKTTLSRLLASLPAGGHAAYADLKYSVTTQSGAFTHGQNYPRKVRVFNADYVEANVGQCEGPIPHILIIGEDNKALAQEVADEQAACTGRISGIEAATSNITKLESAEEDGTGWDYYVEWPNPSPDTSIIDTRPDVAPTFDPFGLRISDHYDRLRHYGH